MNAPSLAIDSHLVSVERIIDGLAGVNYISTNAIATTVYIARHLQKPILVEGSAGVGKTELALSISALLKLPLIRLQCYEGLDESKALYEWKYGKQLLYTQLLKDKLGTIMGDTTDLGTAVDKLHSFGDIFFSEYFLEPRPLLRALREGNGSVLLIDEIDKSDEQFEAFLLEILSAYQISIPELGTVTATTPPLVFLTSNNTRELGDALKRRCLHLYIPLPEPKLERLIVEARVPDIARRLNRQLISFVQQLREKDLKKMPSISETIDWAKTLLLMNAEQLDRELIRSTLNVLLKFEEDIDNVQKDIHEMMNIATRESEITSIRTA